MVKYASWKSERLPKSITKFNEDVNNLSADNNALLDELLYVIKNTNAHQPMDTLNSTDTESTLQSTNEFMASTIASIMNEEKERERRRLNLIIHNLSESTAELAESRKTEDIECVTDICNVCLGANATATKAIRLGKKPNKNNSTIEGYCWLLGIQDIYPT